VAIQTLSDVALAYEEGRHWTGLLRKAGPASVLGNWQDFMYAAGIPGANYYGAAPKAATLLASLDGIMSGPDVEAAGYKKYLHKVLFVPPSTSVGLITAQIYDLVMFYANIDGDGGLQEMTNAVTNRYDGEGCTIMMVSQGIGLGSTNTTTVVYVDQNNDTKTVTLRTRHDLPAGTLLAAVDATDPGALGYAGPFVNCPTGCKTITSIDFDVAVGGIFALVIVKPLGTISTQEVTTPIEVDFFRDSNRAIEIDDGSFIGMIYRGTVSATPTNTMAELSFIWS
jgi:hypothetical protein